MPAPSTLIGHPEVSAFSRAPASSNLRAYLSLACLTGTAYNARMTSAENLIERSTRTVTDFARNGQWFENTETHARISGGYISFDCGHGYTWNAWGGKPAPRPGTRDLCAQCIEAALAEFTAAQS